MNSRRGGLPDRGEMTKFFRKFAKTPNIKTIMPLVSYEFNFAFILAAIRLNFYVQELFLKTSRVVGRRTIEGQNLRRL